MQGNATLTRRIAAVCAVLLGIIFLVSGAWKVISPFAAGELLEEMKVPAGLGPLGSASLGTLELLAAFLLFVPSFRKLGGLLGTGLIVFFIVWIGIYYHDLVGKDCQCFPIIKRAVNPAFFVEDGIMLVMALAAFFFSPGWRRLRGPVIAFLALVMCAGASFGINIATRRVEVPSPVVVNGKPADLSHGKVLLFFYDPSCMHCDAAARFMSKLPWNGVDIVAIPTINPQWADSFLHDTHLKADTSLELAKLKAAFPFGDPPYGVALVNGQVKDRFTAMQFTPPQPEDKLKALGFVK